MALGKLLVDIAANVAGFQSDMGKVAHLAEKTSLSIERTFDRAGKFIAASLTIGAFASFLKSSLDVADALNDLSQITDIAHESLARYTLIARQSGLDNESLAIGLEKLGKSIGQAAKGNEELVKVFQALGVSQQQLKSGDISQVLDTIAQRFSQFEKGNAAGKIELLTNVLGKSGAKFIPFLNSVTETSDSVERLASVFSEDVSQGADEFNDSFELMKTGVSALGAVFLSNLLPIVNNVIKSFDGFTIATDLAFGASKVLGFGLTVVASAAKIVTNIFTSVGQTIAAIGAALSRLADRDFKGAVEVIKLYAKDLEKNLQTGVQDISGYWETFIDGKKKVETEFTNKPKIKVPVINVDDNAKMKSGLEQRLKLIESSIAKEQALLSSRNEMLQTYYELDYLSISEYYEKRRQVTEDAVIAQALAYDKQITALQTFLSKAGKESERISTLTKINDILEKKSKLETEAATNGTKLWFEEQQAIKQFEDKIKDLNASLADATRNTADAAAIRFDQANEAFRKRLEVEGRKADLDKLDRLRTLTVAQARYSQFSEQAQSAQDKFSNAEKSLSMSQEKGLVNEYEYQLLISEQRKATIEELQRVYEAQVRIAEASQDERLLNNAESLRLKIEELKDSSDTLAKSLMEIGENSFGTFLEDIITGSEKAGDAFKKMALSILAEMGKLIAQAATKQFINAFSGNSEIGSGGGIGGIAGFLTGLFKADGGPIIPGRPYVVGERGPEVIVPSSHGTVIPNSASMGGSMVVNNNFVINGTMDRRSQQQIASEVGVSVNRAVKRNK